MESEPTLAEQKAFLALLFEARFDEAIVGDELVAFNDFLRNEAKEFGGFVFRMNVDNANPLWLRYLISFSEEILDNNTRWAITEPDSKDDCFQGSAYPPEWGQLPVFP